MNCLVIIFLLFLTACSYVHVEPVGLQSDTIKLSAKELVFDANGGTDSITTKGNQWLINNYVRVDDTVMYPYKFVLDNYDEKDTLIYDSDRNLYYLYGEFFQYTIIQNENNDWQSLIEIVGTWFTVVKSDVDKIIFSIEPNTTGKERNLFIYLTDRNYGTSVKISQSAD